MNDILQKIYDMLDEYVIQVDTVDSFGEKVRADVTDVDFEIQALCIENRDEISGWEQIPVHDFSEEELLGMIHVFKEDPTWFKD